MLAGAYYLGQSFNKFQKTVLSGGYWVCIFESLKEGSGIAQKVFIMEDKRNRKAFLWKTTFCNVHTKPTSNIFIDVLKTDNPT